MSAGPPHTLRQQEENSAFSPWEDPFPALYHLDADTGIPALSRFGRGSAPLHEARCQGPYRVLLLCPLGQQCQWNTSSRRSHVPRLRSIRQ